MNSREQLKKFSGQVVGDCKCERCGHDCTVKVNKTGGLYYYCARANGGCNYESRCASSRANELFAPKVTKWRKPEAKKIVLAGVDDDDGETVHIVEVEDDDD